MRAKVKEDIIIFFTETGNVDVGNYKPAGVGIERLRWDGKGIVDLEDFSEFWVRPIGDGVFELHIRHFEGCQLVEMQYDQRKHLVYEGGVVQLLSFQGRQARKAYKEEQRSNRRKYQELAKNDSWFVHLAEDSPQQIRQFVAGEGFNLKSLKALAAVVGYLLRRAGRLDRD